MCTVVDNHNPDCNLIQIEKMTTSYEKLQVYHSCLASLFCENWALVEETKKQCGANLILSITTTAAEKWHFWSYFNKRNLTPLWVQALSCWLSLLTLVEEEVSDELKEKRFYEGGDHFFNSLFPSLIEQRFPNLFQVKIWRILNLYLGHLLDSIL